MAGRNNETLVCVPTVAKTVAQMLNDVARAKEAGADVVEIRLDHLSVLRPRLDLETLLKDRPLPYIVTYRYCIGSNSTYYLSVSEITLLIVEFFWEILS